MALKIITQKKFDALPVVNGVRACPTGDYTQIKNFGELCVFGDGCSFGECCSFGKLCRFGKWCRFGTWCRFGKWCAFGAGCSFGKCCSFGEWCSFGECCSFGDHCSFGKCCSFGERCCFCAGCTFEGAHKARTTTPLLSIGYAGSEQRTTYFFDTVDGIIVRSGCFKGTLKEFRAKVLEDVGGDLNSVKALQYLGFANIVAATWDSSQIELHTPVGDAHA